MLTSLGVSSSLSNQTLKGLNFGRSWLANAKFRSMLATFGGLSKFSFHRTCPIWQTHQLDNFKSSDETFNFRLSITLTGQRLWFGALLFGERRMAGTKCYFCTEECSLLFWLDQQSFCSTPKRRPQQIKSVLMIFLKFIFIALWTPRLIKAKAACASWSRSMLSRFLWGSQSIDKINWQIREIGRLSFTHGKVCRLVYKLANRLTEQL